MGILNGRYKFSPDWSCNPCWSSFISFLLNPNPAERPTIHDVLAYAADLKNSGILREWPDLSSSLVAWTTRKDEEVDFHQVESRGEVDRGPVEGRQKAVDQGSAHSGKSAVGLPSNLSTGNPFDRVSNSSQRGAGEASTDERRALQASDLAPASARQGRPHGAGYLPSADSGNLNNVVQGNDRKDSSRESGNFPNNLFDCVSDAGGGDMEQTVQCASLPLRTRARRRTPPLSGEASRPLATRTVADSPHSAEGHVNSESASGLGGVFSGGMRQVSEGISRVVSGVSATAPSLRDGEMRAWVLKATNHHHGFPKAKHLRHIIVGIWEGTVTLEWLVVTLFERPWKTNALVCCKVLICVMKAMQQGPPKLLTNFGIFLRFLGMVEEHWTAVSAGQVILNSSSRKVNLPSRSQDSGKFTAESDRAVKANGLAVASFLAQFANMLSIKIDFHSNHPEFGVHFTTLATLTSRDTIPTQMEVGNVPVIVENLFAIQYALDMTQRYIFSLRSYFDGDHYANAELMETVTAQAALLPIVEESYVVFVASLYLLDALYDRLEGAPPSTLAAVKAKVQSLRESFDLQFNGLHQFYQRCRGVPFVSSMNCIPNMPKVNPLHQWSYVGNNNTNTRASRSRSIRDPDPSGSRPLPRFSEDFLTVRLKNSTDVLQSWLSHMPSRSANTSDVRDHFSELERRDGDDVGDEGGFEAEPFDPFNLYDQLPDATDDWPMENNGDGSGSSTANAHYPEGRGVTSKNAQAGNGLASAHTNAARSDPTAPLALSSAADDPFKSIPVDAFWSNSVPTRRQGREVGDGDSAASTSASMWGGREEIGSFPAPHLIDNLLDMTVEDPVDVRNRRASITNTSRSANAAEKGEGGAAARPLNPQTINPFDSFPMVGNDKFGPTVGGVVSGSSDLVPVATDGKPYPPANGNRSRSPSTTVKINDVGDPSLLNLLESGVASKTIVPASAGNLTSRKGGGGPGKKTNGLVGSSLAYDHHAYVQQPNIMYTATTPSSVSPATSEAAGNATGRSVSVPALAPALRQNMVKNAYNGFQDDKIQVDSKPNNRSPSITTEAAFNAPPPPPKDKSTTKITHALGERQDILNLPPAVGTNPFLSTVAPPSPSPIPAPTSARAKPPAAANFIFTNPPSKPPKKSSVSAPATLLPSNSLTSQADAIYKPDLQPWSEAGSIQAADITLKKTYYECLASFQSWGMELPFSALSVESVLGMGAFAVVYKGTINKIQVKVAIKKLLSTAGQALTAKTLRDFMSELILSLAIRLSMMKDICDGMAYLHSRNPVIIHRDLKSLNILVTESWIAKITDFGLSRVSTEFGSRATDMMTGQIGTYHWMAPEVISGTMYTGKADVFSFSIIMWELLTRQTPYNGMNPVQIVAAVCNASLRPTLPPDGPPALNALIEECWSKDPSKRPAFQAILPRLAQIGKECSNM
eukprot:gene2-2_t